MRLKMRMGVIVLSGLMVLAMAIPTMAAPAGNSTSSTEEIIYNAEADRNYDGAWDAAVTEATEVTVAKGNTVEITVPKRIVLSGATGSAQFNIIVKGDISGDVVINVVPNTKHTPSVGGEVANNFVDGTGTFALKEEAGVKKDIIATITMADTDWTIADDGTEDAITGTTVIDSVAKNCSIATEAGKLTAGKWSQNIGCDLLFTKTIN